MLDGHNWREEQEAYKLRWAVWYSAMLPYLKEPPELKEFIEPPVPKAPEQPRQSLQEIKAIMKSFAKTINKGR